MTSQYNYYSTNLKSRQQGKGVKDNNKNDYWSVTGNKITSLKQKAVFNRITTEFCVTVFSEFLFSDPHYM